MNVIISIVGMAFILWLFYWDKKKKKIGEGEDDEN